ncbi:SDR family NAD(P)-dependent oxidoreductase [Paenibacillus senegalensis]|uniref:SDR family NAD(P)-dependent oxidoreductase n=1 Tax=Paenibacillus senegalensis TaxID=1465766 RepID=UPI000288547B|nr:SDR family oxidoreductase [Paenibacillus senegalensis]
MTLEQRVVMISGAGSGLGEAAAMMIAKQGASVVLCGRRKERVDRVAQAIIEAGGHATSSKVDVSEEQQITQWIAETIQQLGRIDVLINNAAVVEIGTLSDTKLEDWDYQIKNNLRSVFLLTQACLPIMRKQRYGRIINITSSLADNGAGGYAAYGASKAAVEALTRTAAEEEREHNILVNSFNPGTIRSAMHATGQSPYNVVPQLIRLATLADGGPSGQIVHA